MIIQGQTKLTITLNLEADIQGYSVALIQYRKPDGTEGSFNAVVDNAITGIISYDIQDESDIDQTGTWRFWAKIIYDDLTISYGQTNSIEVIQAGGI